MSAKWHIFARILILPALAVLVIAHTISTHGVSPLLDRLLDDLHAPGFTLITLLIWAALPLSLNVAPRLAVSAVLASILAVAAEGSQYFSARNADLGDLGSDFTGIGLGLAVAFTIGLFRQHRQQYWAIVTTAAMLLAILSWFTLASPAQALWSLSRQRASLPVLAGFEHDWEPFLYARSPTNHVIRIPKPEQFAVPGRYAAAVNLGASGKPGMELRTWADWLGYSSLSFLAASSGSESIRVALRIHDAQHNQQPGDRYQYNFEITAEPQRHTIPISEILKTPSGRKLDPHRIEAMIFFVSRPNGTERMIIDDIRLHPD